MRAVAKPISRPRGRGRPAAPRRGRRARRRGRGGPRRPHAAARPSTVQRAGAAGPPSRGDRLERRAERHRRRGSSPRRRPARRRRAGRGRSRRVAPPVAVQHDHALLDEVAGGVGLAVPPERVAASPLSWWPWHVHAGTASAGGEPATGRPGDGSGLWRAAARRPAWTTAGRAQPWAAAGVRSWAARCPPGELLDVDVLEREHLDVLGEPRRAVHVPDPGVGHRHLEEHVAGLGAGLHVDLVAQVEPAVGLHDVLEDADHVAVLAVERGAPSRPRTSRDPPRSSRLLHLQLAASLSLVEAARHRTRRHRPATVAARRTLTNRRRWISHGRARSSAAVCVGVM